MAVVKGAGVVHNGIVSDPVYLITGATGYLGRRLAMRAAERGAVYAATHRRRELVRHGRAVAVDVGDRSGVFEIVERLRPSVVIHAAAVNPGQGDDEAMWRVNVDGSRFVAEAARSVGARLVAVSTDIVHDGRAGPYADDVPPSPINEYGRSKAAGESAVLEADPEAVVVRTSLTYGLDEIDRGTAGFAARLARGEDLSLFSDVLRNPVWVDSLADALVALADTDYAGLLNVAGRQVLSRDEFGRAMLAYWGISDGGRIRSIRAADVSDSIPLDLRLVSDRAEALLGMTFPGVDEVTSAALPGRDADCPS